jgi:hypothetical protein
MTSLLTHPLAAAAPDHSTDGCDLIVDARELNGINISYGHANGKTS